VAESWPGSEFEPGSCMSGEPTCSDEASESEVCSPVGRGPCLGGSIPWADGGCWWKLAPEEVPIFHKP
jgi:hypothetical protein